MRVNIVYLLVLPFALVAFFAGSYLVRWIAVLIAGIIFLAFILEESELPHLPRRKQGTREKKTDVQRLADVIKLAKKGTIAREIISDAILEIYEVLEDDRDKAKRRMEEVSSSIHSKGNFLEDLENMIKIVEADVNEDRRGS